MNSQDFAWSNMISKAINKYVILKLTKQKVNSRV